MQDETETRRGTKHAEHTSQNEGHRRNMSKQGDANTATGMSIVYRDLSIYGFGRRLDYQKSVSTFLGAHAKAAFAQLRRTPRLRVDILQDFEGIVTNGEMLLVLGKPGSGCTTFLKTLAGHMSGLHCDDGSTLNYQGIPPCAMYNQMRGNITYQAELDLHFPTLTMGEMLEFATNASDNNDQKQDLSAKTEVTVKSLGLTRTLGTKMGNDYISGVSGGERKRGSIAEILVGQSMFQCWDNSTRGLDSSSALDFVKTLRHHTTSCKGASVVSLYQASEAIYDLFDKVLILCEGRQIYFGSTKKAKSYFVDLGFECSEWSTTPDFLTAVTDPEERRVGKDASTSTPNSASDFALAWKKCRARANMIEAMELYDIRFPPGGAQNIPSSAHTPYLIPITRQISLCTKRGFKRLLNELSAPISALSGNLVVSIILGTMFYNLSGNTSSFFGRGVLLFITILLNTSLAAFESVAQWEIRPILEKHFQYAFYHPYAEAIASMICDLPNKLLLALGFNLPVYFLANLRRSPGAFFTFYLFAFVALLNGSMIYRSMGAMSRTLEGSQPAGAVFALLMMLYNGFVIPFNDMKPWLQWFAYINPVYYAFESLAINEFAGRDFQCSEFVPQGGHAQYQACVAVGAKPGSSVVSGEDYIRANWDFQTDHLWRNLGIMMALMVCYGAIYIVCTEYISLQPSRGEVLLFRKGKNVPPLRHAGDEENQRVHEKPEKIAVANEEPIARSDSDPVATDAATFVWTNLSYDIKVGKEQKRILDNVEGWVMPKTMTALMGASGAGKTTLLNLLADRVSTGIIHGERTVDLRHQDVAFARKIGYAQQQDLHLNTTTVREALEFSALLRQPPKYSREEKLAYVSHIAGLLELDKDGLLDAVVGIPGEGLNVAQRKRVTIGVELAARPELLLFLDEPTSGLDSDSSMSFCRLLRVLADHGQAILCVVHQPSAQLLTYFDRLLLLSEGKSLYFGDFGANFSSLISYFERQGARKLEAGENPAEWMLEVSKASTEMDDGKEVQDWAALWKASPERVAIKVECGKMKLDLSNPTRKDQGKIEEITSEFATPLWYQITTVTKRAFLHDWYSPTYLWSKSFTTFGLAFFNGITFWNSGSTPQDLQNLVFSLFILTTMFGTHVQLIMKRFHDSRVQYESRERQSRTYSWVAFLISNIAVELCSQTVISVIAFVAWYYPVGLWHNAEAQGELSSRGGLTFLLIWSLMVLFQTLSQMLMTIMPDVPTGINIGNLLFMLSLIFSGPLVAPDALPRFWIFMYRATPLSYYISGLVGTGLSGMNITCAAKDLLQIPSIPDNSTCATYLSSYLKSSGGRLLNGADTSSCQFCPYSKADSVLATFGIYFDERWQNWGITMVFNVINIGLAFLIYWLVCRKKSGVKIGTGVVA